MSPRVKKRKEKFILVITCPLYCPPKPLQVLWGTSLSCSLIFIISSQQRHLYPYPSNLQVITTKLDFFFSLLIPRITFFFSHHQPFSFAQWTIKKSVQVYSSTPKHKVDKYPSYSSTPKHKVDKYPSYSSTPKHKVDKYPSYSSTPKHKVDKYPSYSSTPKHKVDKYPSYSSKSEEFQRTQYGQPL